LDNLLLDVDSSCTVPCAGNSNYMCGDTNYLTIYVAGKFDI